MAAARLALLLSSSERHFITAINFFATMIIARLVAPAEFGIFVLGASVMALVEVMRDLGTSSYLVQQQDLPVEKTRTAFTIVLGLTLAAAAFILMSVEFIASYYALPGLKNYLRVSLIGFLLGPFVSPIHALLRRDFRFGAISITNVTTSLLNAAVVVLLATLGFSYMSFAWANVASGIAGLSLLLFFRPDLSIFRPSLGAWKSVVSFGAFDSFAKSLAIAGDYIPNLIFGRILTVEAVGLYQRAGTVCRLPERVLLAGINTAILPIFAGRAREGRDLKEGYLRATELVTALLWPALLMLILFAYTFVLVMLGGQWLAIVSLVQIMTAARLFAYSAILDYAAILAAGAVRYTVPLMIVQVVSSLGVVVFTAEHGLHAVALGALCTTAFNGAVSICLLRSLLGFTWGEYLQAVRKSVVVTGFSLAGPLLLIAVAGPSANGSIVGGIIAIVLCGLGWLGGLWLTQHPLLKEIMWGRDLLLTLFDHRRVASASAWLISWLPGRRG